jgi:outer membrane murein-binding lipoprotein Lpp
VRLKNLAKWSVAAVAAGAILFTPVATAQPPSLETRVATLESQVAALESQVAALESQVTLGQPFIVNQDFVVNQTSQSVALVECPSGARALSGGWSQSGPTVSDVFVADTQPDRLLGGSQPDGWSVRVINRSTEVALTLRVFVICAPLQ